MKHFLWFPFSYKKGRVLPIVPIVSVGPIFQMLVSKCIECQQYSSLVFLFTEAVLAAEPERIPHLGLR